MQTPSWAKGYRFYEEFSSAKDKRRGKNTGNVIAVDMTACCLLICNCKIGPHLTSHFECFSAIFNKPNSEVTLSTIADHILRETYKFISREEAERLHPKLIATMKSDSSHCSEE